MLIVAWGNAGNAPGKKIDELALAESQFQSAHDGEFGLQPKLMIGHSHTWGDAPGTVN